MEGCLVADQPKIGPEAPDHSEADLMAAREACEEILGATVRHNSTCACRVLLRFRAEGRAEGIRDVSADMVAAYNNGKAEGAREEREAVVRWLNREAADGGPQRNAQSIERGDHLPKGE
jgi:hypothetical protein